LITKRYRNEMARHEVDGVSRYLNQALPVNAWVYVYQPRRRRHRRQAFESVVVINYKNFSFG
jgi:hypothetical protein